MTVLRGRGSQRLAVLFSQSSEVQKVGRNSSRFSGTTWNRGAGRVAESGTTWFRVEWCNCRGQGAAAGGRTGRSAEYAEHRLRVQGQLGTRPAPHSMIQYVPVAASGATRWMNKIVMSR